jgi:uroporphyrin-III C-methyltransferase/precorrin-2 dehydrogenase/sirohydrochlorin ferrochelatase/uroporphyrin-III C-methyltransferase
MNNDACVYLVGAGPGDPELLTVKAQRLLQQADVVVYDRLISAEILALIPAGTTRIYVGKRTGHHHMSQAAINDLLVSLARKGRQVVRLKGGDPFVFGRGSEEAQYLARHGVYFEVVPGITAASACGAYAGIPLSHRGLSNGVRFVTGHCRADEPLRLDWQGLADPNTTLVIYMGLASLPELQRELVAAGLPKAMPAAIIEAGTTPQQRTHLTSLEQLACVAQRQAVRSPALIIIGRVVTLADELHWFGATASEWLDCHAQQAAKA